MDRAARHELRRLRLELLTTAAVERRLARERDLLRERIAAASAAATVGDPAARQRLPELNAEFKELYSSWQTAHLQLTHRTSAVRAAERQLEAAG